MSSDKELADKVVAVLGHGAAIHAINFSEINFSEFVRDWRVAGALMERCRLVSAGRYGDMWEVAARVYARADACEAPSEASNKSLPRAIIEVCVKALS